VDGRYAGAQQVHHEPPGRGADGVGGGGPKLKPASYDVESYGDWPLDWPPNWLLRPPFLLGVAAVAEVLVEAVTVS
jgi:hypothetical protein